jgi:hypothetical protein
MWKHLASVILFISACAPIVGCGANSRTADGYSGAPTAATERSPRDGYGPARNEPEPTQDRSKDDEKRGNTPVGKDRTGAGPADGAILDPHGVVTKQPVLRERQ